MTAGLKDQDIEIIKSVINSYAQVDEAILFGSRAKGNYKSGSDIDIALKGSDLKQITWKIHSQLEEDTLLPYFFDVVNYNDISNSELISHIDRVGITIYQKDSPNEK